MHLLSFSEVWIVRVSRSVVNGQDVLKRVYLYSYFAMPWAFKAINASSLSLLTCLEHVLQHHYKNIPPSSWVLAIMDWAYGLIKECLDFAHELCALS